MICASSAASKSVVEHKPKAALDQILDHVRAEPSRTWSIIITIYGDAIVPRGGCVWLGTLLAFFQAIDVSDTVVRTAMSRLASDGWLERTKVGRNSFYRLADKGRTTFAEAARRIYVSRSPVSAARFDFLLLFSNGPERDAARLALEAAGYGSPLAGVWVGLAGRDVPAAAQGALQLEAGGSPAALRALAARSWPLEATAAAYRRFIATFEPMRAALGKGEGLSDIETLVARVLLIHEYRRVVLRDPILPADVLPEDWPGAPARDLCASLYRDLVVPSERWLDMHATDETGAPLPSVPEVFRRFQDPP